jgi:Flp pilus assembly pilin Flp
LATREPTSRSFEFVHRSSAAPPLVKQAFGLYAQWEGVKSHMWTELNRIVLSLYTRAKLGRQEGQALVEYTLILALVSIVAITALTGLGEAIVKQLESVTTTITGA